MKRRRASERGGNSIKCARVSRGEDDAELRRSNIFIANPDHFLTRVVRIGHLGARLRQAYGAAGSPHQVSDPFGLAREAALQEQVGLQGFSRNRTLTERNFETERQTKRKACSSGGIRR
jgi:hypothetical protein